jgi:putative PIN family toxin of toxin-antitoxin system
MLRAVLDPNVLVSAIISDGKPRQLLRKGIVRKFSLVTSDLILKELVSVLRRPKFKTDENEIQRIVLVLINHLKS